VKPYYEHGRITIYHGDCLSVMDSLAPHYGERPFDLLLTDPPYGIGFAAQPTKWQRRALQAPEAWDDSTSAERVAVARSLARYQVIWGGNYYRSWAAGLLLSPPSASGSPASASSEKNATARSR